MSAAPDERTGGRTGAGRVGRVGRVGVVVPAHDERQLLPRCLAALEVAAARVGTELGVEVDVVVVCDTCTDGTTEVAARAGARVLPVRLRNVGAARAAGVELVLAADPAAGTWLAPTDADTTVGPDWLCRQLGYFAAGFDAVAGTVVVHDWEGTRRRWRCVRAPLHLRPRAPARGQPGALGRRLPSGGRLPPGAHR